MTNFVFVCPIPSIIYPSEAKKLIIENKKEQQLMLDCFKEAKPFGALIIMDGKTMEYGTLVEIKNIKENKQEDILFVELRGEKIFRVLEMVTQVPDKPYEGAIVSYPENDTMKVNPKLAKLVNEEVKRLYTLLNIEDMVPSKPDWISYDVAHRLGLTKEQEYEFLTICNEIQRMEYLRRYFNGIMPEVHDLDILKSRINLN